ncbi:MAG: hypothetical protein EBT06_15100 [Gammaproteobacteria bacterium]|nr:hypothetical protein [Gammaproteobacteria bacterium]NBT46187.1 hypothetical protein [Gammaproteobacteria bacterium]NBY22416.1 hypothetical protein [Gammaproteobacteria bacterium]
MILEPAIESIFPTEQDSPIYTTMRQQDNGFNVKNLSFSYSLIYPKASDETNRINALRNNVLMVGLDGPALSTPDTKSNRYGLAPTSTVLENFTAPIEVQAAVTYDALPYDMLGNDKMPSYNKVNIRQTSGMTNSWGVMTLIPVDSHLLTNGRFDRLFTYSNDTTPAAVYALRPDGRNGFNGGLIRAILNP